MGGIGIVTNPLARRNRRQPGLARRLRDLLRDDGEVVEASTPDELERAVERLRAARIDVLGIAGGDGTGQVVLTAFARAAPVEPLPRLLLLRAGTMNTVAHGHGIRGTPEHVLREVLARRRQGLALRTVARDLLAVEADGGPARHGFIFGTGVVVTFLEAYYATGRPSPAIAALLVARLLGSIAVGGAFARRVTRRDWLRVTSDGDEWTDPSYLALLAGTTPDIGFGFKPFARCAEQPGFFHAVGITGTLGQLALALPRVARGAPWRRRVAQDELARALVVEGEGLGYTVDGDLYRAERSVRIETGPGLGVVLP